jgi:hypothetical protein
MTHKRFPERRARTSRNGRLVMRGHASGAPFERGIRLWRMAVTARAEKRGVTPEVIISECTDLCDRFGEFAQEATKTLGNSLVSMMLGGFLKSVDGEMLTRAGATPLYIADFQAAIDFVADGFINCAVEEEETEP